MVTGLALVFDYEFEVAPTVHLAELDKAFEEFDAHTLASVFLQCVVYYKLECVAKSD